MVKTEKYISMSMLQDCACELGLHVSTCYLDNKGKWNKTSNDCIMCGAVNP